MTPLPNNYGNTNFNNTPHQASLMSLIPTSQSSPNSLYDSPIGESSLFTLSPNLPVLLCLRLNVRFAQNTQITCDTGPLFLGSKRPAGATIGGRQTVGLGLAGNPGKTVEGNVWKSQFLEKLMVESLDDDVDNADGGDRDKSFLLFVVLVTRPIPHMNLEPSSSPTRLALELLRVDCLLSSISPPTNLPPPPPPPSYHTIQITPTRKREERKAIPRTLLVFLSCTGDPRNTVISGASAS